MCLNTHTQERLGQSMAIGIDVSKATLSICGLLSDGGLVRVTISNKKAAVDELVGVLKAVDFSGKILLESTSYYHWLVTVSAVEAGLDVRLVNPLISSKHSLSKIRKTKTDSADAESLASMALTERHLPAPCRRDAAWVVLRQEAGLLTSMDKELQRLRAIVRSQRDALLTVGKTDNPLIDGFAQQIHALEKQFKRAQAELSKRLAASVPVERQVHLASVLGLSAYTAGLLALFLSTDVKDAKSWCAFVGLDVSVAESGNWKGRSRLSKRGNAYLRKCLFRTAWGAMIHDEEFRAYYDALRAGGRGYKESLIIMARKLLCIIYAVWTQNKNYQSGWLVA